jgi:predicted transcriptional regulator
MLNASKVVCASGNGPVRISEGERRSRMDIEASILECFLVESASVNKIMRHANLNRDAVKIHVSRMISHELVKKIGGGSKEYMVYSATEKGILWLKRYRSLADEGGFGRRPENRLDRDF